MKYYDLMIWRWTKFLIVSFFCGVTTIPVYAQNEHLSLKPSSNWTIDYADDSCRLIRQFGTGKNATIAIFTRFAPSDGFQLTIAGNPVALSRVTRAATVKFGPNEDEQQLKFGIGRLGDDKPTLIFLGHTFIAAAEQTDKKPHKKTWKVKSKRIATSDERKAAVTQLSIGRPLRKPIQLELGAMDKPLAALSTCMDELLTHWGVDVAAHKSLTRPVRPARNPSRWVNANDYPTNMLRSGKQAIVHFRLSIDKNGKSSACHIQQSTRPKAFDNVVCKSLMRRAKFHPALDKDGHPIASFYRNTVRFSIP